jgi:tetratricopeptide (TPR) repeat protein
MSENERVGVALRRARLLVQQWHYQEAEAAVQDALMLYPGRSDALAALAWIQRKQNDFASARVTFERAHQLGCNERDAYWHWSEMEAASEEWTASAKAAELGIERLGPDQGLLFRLGYALHRHGRELLREGQDATKICKRAQEILEKAQALRDCDERNYAIRSQIYRAIVLNLEALEDGPALARYFGEWERDCPRDPYLKSEYERLRQDYPQFLSAR